MESTKKKLLQLNLSEIKMKKMILFTLFILIQIASVQAFDVEARAAYFLPQDSRMRDIYSKKGFAEYEIEAANPLSDLFCTCPSEWDGFVNLSFYQKHGRSTCINDKTQVTNWTLNFGVKRYFIVCESFRPYLGLGCGAAHVKFHDESDYVSKHTKRWGVAILAKSGIRYDLTCNLFLDLFADYSYSWFNFQHRKSCVSVRNVNTGGLKLGLGLGYQF